MRHLYLVDIMAGNDFIKDSVQFIQHSDHLQRKHNEDLIAATRSPLTAIGNKGFFYSIFIF